MSRRLGQGAGLVAASVTAWALLVPGFATADEAPEPVPCGDCAATLDHGNKPTSPGTDTGTAVNSADPGSADPGSADPDSADPGSADPDTADPNTADSDTTDSDTTDSDSADPPTADPDAAEQESSVATGGDESAATSTTPAPESPVGLPVRGTPTGAGSDAVAAVGDTAKGAFEGLPETLDGVGDGVRQLLSDDHPPTPELDPDEQTDPPQAGEGANNDDPDTNGPDTNDPDADHTDTDTDADDPDADDTDTDDPDADDTGSDEDPPTASGGDTADHAGKTHSTKTHPNKAHPNKTPPDKAAGKTDVSTVTDETAELAELPENAVSNTPVAVDVEPPASDAEQPTSDVEPPASDTEQPTPDSERDQAEGPVGDPEIHAGGPDSGLRGLLPHEQPRVPLGFAVLALLVAVTTVSRRVARGGTS